MLVQAKTLCVGDWSSYGIVTSVEDRADGTIRITTNTYPHGYVMCATQAVSVYDGSD